MSTAHKTVFNREVLEIGAANATAAHLQANLVNLIDLALLLKQAHWNVIGPHFRSVHLQLDEIIASVRSASDEIAERMSTLGVAPDGRSFTIAKKSDLDNYADGFQKVSHTIVAVADSIKTVVDRLRDSIEELGELDPISEDLCIGITASLEKHLWMVQAQEA